MAKVRLTIAAAFLAAMTVFATAGELSYESRGYGGPLYIGPNFHSNDSASPKRSRERRTYRRTRQREAQPSRDRTPEKTDTAKASPVKNDGQTENSSLSAPGKDETVETARNTSLNGEVDSENSTLSTLGKDEAVEVNTAERETKAKKEPETSKTVDCKKYFPTAGMTISVPCD